MGIQTGALSGVAPRAKPDEYARESAPTPRSALALLTNIPFDLVVLAHPQPDLDLRQFLAVLRRPESLSRRARIIVRAVDLADADLQGLAEDRLEVHSVREPLPEDLVARILSGDRRVLTTVMVKVASEQPHGRAARIWQSHNLSVSGILVRTDDTLPVGTHVETRFSLPGDPEPFITRADVVRKTSTGEVPGIALRFVDLAARDRSRLESFLTTQDD